MVGDEVFIEFVLGIRQGCVLSPLFLTLFINDLVERVKDKVKGVSVGGVKIVMLLFADDIVLTLDGVKEVQKALDVCSKFASKWGLRWNCSKGKSEVMVIGKREGEGGEEWRLGEEIVGETGEYEYLGLVVNKGGIGDKARRRLLEKARRMMWRVWMLVGRERGLSMKGKVRVWQTMVQSILEVGAEVMRDVRWEEAERLQLRMMRMVLGVGGKARMINEVVRGELGLWRLRARRWRKRLMYWWCMERRKVPELVRRVYCEGRKKVLLGKRSGWVWDTKSILEKIGLGWVWSNGCWMEKRKWKRLVCRSLQEFEEKEWREGLQSKSKAVWYRRVKKKLQEESYVSCGERWNWGRSLMVKMRGGILPLRVEEGRWEGLEREDRVCLVCKSGEVEDEKHFVEDCHGYDDIRRKWRRWGLFDGEQDEVVWKVEEFMGCGEIMRMRGYGRLLLEMWKKRERIRQTWK